MTKVSGVPCSLVDYMNFATFQNFLKAMQATAATFGYSVDAPMNFVPQPLDEAGNVVSNVYLEFEPA